ncbi:IS110 family transposase [Streptomyces sp. NPDC003697]
MADQIVVVGGVDTHTDFHQAAVIDSIGRHLATKPFPTTPDGYRRLLEWMRSHGDVLVVGVEGTGAYGSELARFLSANEVTVVDVDRPDRKARRANGKSDPVDAYAAATAVLSGRANGRPKTRDGIVEAIRSLRVVRRSAIKARTQTINQIRTLIVSAPAEVRERLRGLPTYQLISQLAPTGVTVDIRPRDLPMALIGSAGGALALWAHAPAKVAVPVALLIVLDIRAHRWRRRT